MRRQRFDQNVICPSNQGQQQDVVEIHLPPQISLLEGTRGQDLDKSQQQVDVQNDSENDIQNTTSRATLALPGGALGLGQKLRGNISTKACQARSQNPTEARLCFCLILRNTEYSVMYFVSTFGLHPSPCPLFSYHELTGMPESNHSEGNTDSISNCADQMPH